MATPLPALSAPIPASVPRRRQAVQWHNALFVLPYLTGERTPHNDPAATGVVFGLDGASNR